MLLKKNVMNGIEKKAVNVNALLLWETDNFDERFQVLASVISVERDSEIQEILCSEMVKNKTYRVMNYTS